MTAIIAVASNRSIWLAADRRLSKPDGSSRDDAQKILCLETPDGITLVGYAGLGATARGIQPSDWMSKVLRGRNLPLEESLGTICRAMREQFPNHMLGASREVLGTHVVLAPAFLADEPQIYSIVLERREGDCFEWAYRKHLTPGKTARPVNIVVTGSGMRPLKRDQAWRRDLIRLVKARDNDKVSELAVPDFLANLIRKVSSSDCLVGPDSIVAWKNRREEGRGGGAHQEYVNGVRSEECIPLPSIGNGTDEKQLADLMMHLLMRDIEIVPGEAPRMKLDIDEANAAIRSADWSTDERLR